MISKKYMAVLIIIIANLSAKAQSKNEITDSLSAILARAYVYPDRADAMIKSIQKKESYYQQINQPEELAKVLTADLHAVYADKHLLVRYDPQLEKRIGEFNHTRIQDPDAVKKERQQNFFFRKTEILPGNIGYIEFTNFADTNALSRKTVRAAFNFVANADALIVDLRNNFGGNAAMCSEIMSYFFSAKTYLGRHYNRIENRWQENWVTNKPEITGGLYLKMPVYILTSRSTFSAAEGLAYALQQLKKSNVIGETTAGGAHATRSFALGHGYVAFIPFVRGENAISNTDWEGNGVIPTDTSSAQQALMVVKKLIYLQKQKATTDSTEIRKFTWLLNDLKTAWPVNKDDLPLYSGQFEEFAFFIKDNQIYGKVNQKGQPYNLIAIGATLFKTAQQYQVEFLKDQSGKVNTLKLYWPDGWVDIVKRTAAP